MNCTQTQTHLSAYSAGLLSGALQGRVEAHLAICEACQRRLQEFRDLDGLLRRECLQPDQELVRQAVRLADAGAFIPRWVRVADSIAPLILAVLSVPLLMLYALSRANLWEGPLRLSVSHLDFSSKPLSAAVLLLAMGLVAGLISWLANRASEALE